VGHDTVSYRKALKSALREAPSVLLIGEIRDRESMQAALSFAETGHLVFSTLHATSAAQTIERILGFFEQDEQAMLLLQLSQTLEAVIAQRLVPTLDGKRAAALEVMLTTARIRDLIQKAGFQHLRQTIAAGRGEGMQLFDQALFKLYSEKRISEALAIEYADQPTDLRLQIAGTENRESTKEINLLADDDEEQQEE